MKKILISVFLLLVAGIMFAIDCPQDGLSMYWTGETQVEWGKLEKVYQCPQGHRYLVPDSSSSSYRNPSYGEVICPLDGMSMYFTGKMHGIAKVYRCPAGHEADVR